jgi:colicin import membrane protein
MTMHWLPSLHFARTPAGRLGFAMALACAAAAQAQTMGMESGAGAAAVIPAALAASAPAWSAAQLAELAEADKRAEARRKLEHERIRHEREAIKVKLHKDEAACYQHFAVEDCLRDVRAGVRQAEGRLRTQEIELNDAERKEKAAARLRSIDEKQRIKHAPVEPVIRKLGGAVRHAPAAPHSAGAGGSGTSPVTPPRDPQEAKALHDQEAKLRAQQQRSRLQSLEVQQAAREASNTDRAAKVRERHARALKGAQEHRERLENARAQALADGRKPAAPLPTGASSVSPVAKP